MRLPLHRILAAALALLWASMALGGQITLRPSARVPADRELVLADVAELSGADAQALAGVVVHPALAGGRRAQMEVRDVRAALDAGGVNWGRVSLQGSVCEVVAAAQAAPAAAPPPAAPTAMPRTAPTHETIDPSGPPTVRKAAAQMLSRLFEVGLDDLQIAFDDPQSPLLAAGGAGRRIEVQPAASASASRIPLNIWVYEGERVVVSGQARADVLVRRPTVIVTSALRRGQVISASDVSAEVVWTEPTAGAPISTLADAVGQVCRTRIPTGTALRAELIEPAVLVKRGELVTIHCISGGVVVKAPARAQADGRDGETIEFKMDKSKRPFLARISGAGRAVMLSGAGAGTMEAGQ